ncbi:ABC transporter permease, partial [Acinetobacter baumannii]
MSRLLTILAPVALIAVLLGGWEVACRALSVPVFLLPAPLAIASALVADAPTLFLSGWNTLSM